MKEKRGAYDTRTNTGNTTDIVKRGYINLSYIKKQMQDRGLFKSYTLHGVLDKLDVIECFESPGQKLRVGELLEKQKALYLDLGVTVQTSL